MPSKCVVAGLVAANLAILGVGAVPLDLRIRDDTVSATTSSTASAPSSSTASTSTWLPDFYIAPAAPTGVYADTDGENILIPVPSLVLEAPGAPSSAPLVQLPVATNAPASQVPPSPAVPASTPAPLTSTLYSTVWITEAPQSATVTSVVPPSETPNSSASPSPDGNTAPVSNARPKPYQPPSSASNSGILATYYADWTSDQMQPEQIDFNRFDWVDFAFAVPTSDFNLTFAQDDSISLLTRLVSLGHAANKRVKLSVGGWDGSKYFSQAVSTPANTAVFVNNIMAAVKTYNVDGIDIDWEYPGRQGEGGNGVSPSDTTNFLAFLQQLRQRLGPKMLLTAAVATQPFYLPSSSASSSTQIFNAFGQVLDYILIMNYDIADDSAPTPASNAPLLSHGPACSSQQTAASAESAIDAWTAAGYPAAKIILGVPSYGYKDNTAASSLGETPARRKRSSVPTSQLDGDMKRPTRRQFAALAPGPVISASVPAAVNLASVGAPSSANVVIPGTGQVQFSDIVRAGALVKNATFVPPSSIPITYAPASDPGPPTAYTGAGGWVRHWDACSSTPYLVSQSQKRTVPYDDPASLQMKAEYAMQRKVAGVNIFDVHGDVKTWDLVDALRRGLNAPVPSQ